MSHMQFFYPRTATALGLAGSKCDMPHYHKHGSSKARLQKTFFSFQFLSFFNGKNYIKSYLLSIGEDTKDQQTDLFDVR